MARREPGTVRSCEHPCCLHDSVCLCWCIPAQMEKRHFQQLWGFYLSFSGLTGLDCGIHLSPFLGLRSPGQTGQARIGPAAKRRGSLRPSALSAAHQPHPLSHQAIQWPGQKPLIASHHI